MNGIIYRMDGKWLGCIQPMCNEPYSEPGHLHNELDNELDNEPDNEIESYSIMAFELRSHRRGVCLLRCRPF